jgi:cell division transport system ATP-binding protein
VIGFDLVSKRYEGDHQALTDVSFSVEAGEMAFVTGHSGAGKSTLLKLLAMIERPTNGVVTLDGRKLNTVRPAEIPKIRRKLGMVFQDHRLLLDRSVFANVELPLIIAGVSPADRGRRVRAALEKVGLLSYEKQLPEALSTGEQQRVGIARAIVAKPAVLIADEPTGNLDPDTSIEIMRLLDRINRTGTTVVMVTHDSNIVNQMRRRVIEIEGGRIVRDQARGVYG